MGSLSDQLFKAGLVSEEQLKEKAKPARNTQKNRRKTKATNSDKTSRSEPKQITAKRSNENPISDLETFYRQRETREKQERQEAARKKREEAALKKEQNRKINALIKANLQNSDQADIRYNFVVGTTIKYLFVTEEQQEQLANGQLAITFLGGKRCLVPVDTGRIILAINPGKIVILNDVESYDETNTPSDSV